MTVLRKHDIIQWINPKILDVIEDWMLILSDVTALLQLLEKDKRKEGARTGVL